MKNTFPPNLDEDSPLFKTDGFRMFCFKVLPCSKRFCHDWTTCPFSHPAEKAKRRDPRVHAYTGVACPECKKNVPCPRGDACTFAHNVFEYWLHPSRYRTQLCNDGINCNRKICFFAHTLEDLRVSSVKVMPSESGAKLGSPTSDAFDPFSLPDDGQKPPQTSTSPVSPLSCMDQFDPFNSAASSRRSSMQLPKPRMSIDHASAVAGRMSLDQAFVRPQQHLLHQRNSIDMAELQLQHLQLAAMKAQLQMQQTALQTLAAQQQMQMQQQQGINQPVEQIAQMLAQLQLANSLAGGDQLMPGPALQALLPQHQLPQLMAPSLSQVLMQQMLMQQQQQQQQQQQKHAAQQNLQEQAFHQLQLGGLSAAELSASDMGLLTPAAVFGGLPMSLPAGVPHGQLPDRSSAELRHAI